MTPFERFFVIMTKPWVAVCYMAFIVLSFFYLDQPIAYYFHSLNLGIWAQVLKGLTKLGLGVVYLVSLFLLAIFFRYLHQNKKWEMRAWFLWLCVLIPSVVCLVLKMLFGRARPELLFNEHLYGFYGLKTQSLFWSFPSGHTSTVMGLVLGLTILFPRYGYTFIVAGLTVAISRILLTQHYLGDILIAGYLALVEIGIFYYWLRRKNWLINSTVIAQ